MGHHVRREVLRGLNLRRIAHQGVVQGDLLIKIGLAVRTDCQMLHQRRPVLLLQSAVNEGADHVLI